MTVAPLGAETPADLDWTGKGQQHMTGNQSAPNWLISSHLNRFQHFFFTFFSFLFFFCCYIMRSKRSTCQSNFYQFYQYLTPLLFKFHTKCTFFDVFIDAQ